MDVSEEAADRLRGLGVAAVWLFGSQATGEAHPGSDTDVAVLLVEGADTPGLLDRGRMGDLLAGELGLVDVDLVVLDEAPLELRAEVVAGGRLVVRLDEPRRVAFQVETLSRWGDVAGAVRVQDRAYLSRVAREGLE